MSLILLFLSCAHKQYTHIGTVDVIEPTACIIQLDDETVVEVDVKLCALLREGDIITIKRKNLK